LSIRLLRRGDREPIHRILVETDVFSEEEVGIALELIDVVLNNASQKDYVISVYEEGNEIHGYYCIGPTPATQSTFDMYWIATRPSLHGRGVGSKLEGHAVDFIKSKGGKLVIAETSSQPTYKQTRQFYKKRGYTELARIRDYYRSGDDLVVYGKYLT
jgi:ribosomal protein S18 acetylase RimI-like enzyme